MYSDIKQGNSETTDQLDQHIKNIIERYQYTTKAEVMVHCTELLFHAMKHFEVKKWVSSKEQWEEVTYTALLQYAKEHKMTIKDFNRHKSNGRIAQVTTVDEIRTNMVREVKVMLEERVAPKHVINAVHHIDTKNAQHLGKSVINVVLRTI